MKGCLLKGDCLIRAKALEKSQSIERLTSEGKEQHVKCIVKYKRVSCLAAFLGLLMLSYELTITRSAIWKEFIGTGIKLFGPSFLPLGLIIRDHIENE